MTLEKPSDEAAEPYPTEGQIKLAIEVRYAESDHVAGKLVAAWAAPIATGYREALDRASQSEARVRELQDGIDHLHTVVAQEAERAVNAEQKVSELEGMHANAHDVIVNLRRERADLEAERDTWRERCERQMELKSQAQIEALKLRTLVADGGEKLKTLAKIALGYIAFPVPAQEHALRETAEAALASQTPAEQDGRVAAVRRVADGPHPDTITVISDDHDHYYVPASALVDAQERIAELEALAGQAAVDFNKHERRLRDVAELLDGQGRFTERGWILEARAELIPDDEPPQLMQLPASEDET